MMLAARVSPSTDVYQSNRAIERHGRSGNAAMARRVFEALGDGERDLFSWHFMIVAYARNGEIRESKLLFDRMPGRDLPTWNAMLTAFARNGQLDLAEDLFRSMPQQNLISWTAILTAYADSLQIDRARAIFRAMPQRNLVSWTAMLTAHAQVGDLSSCRSIFKVIPERDLVAWNAILAAYAIRGAARECDRIFEAMPQHDLFSWTTILAARANSIEDAKRAFDRCPEHNLVAYNAMLSAYASHGFVLEAEDLFQRSMPAANLVSWNTLLASYAHNSRFDRAEHLFLHEIPLHDHVSITLLVSMLGEMAADADDPSQSRRLLARAEEIFDRLPSHTLISSNAMLSAYARNGRLDQARRIFAALRERDLDLVAWNSMLSALAHGSSTLDEARTTYGEMPYRNLVSHTSMLDALIRHGCVDEAAGIFEERMPQHNAAAWNSMLSAFVHNRCVSRARALLARIPETNLVSWNILLFAYAQEGHLERAKRFFDRMPEKSLVSWGSLLATFVTLTASNRHRRDREHEHEHKTRSGFLTPLHLLPWMNLSGISPDKICFVSALISCSHAGKVYAGKCCFVSMHQDFGIEATKQHYSCLLDLLVRAGYLAQACDLMASMPFVPEIVDWVCLLGGCRNSSDRRWSGAAASEIVQYVVNLNPPDGAAYAYVLLSNIQTSPLGGITRV